MWSASGQAQKRKLEELDAKVQGIETDMEVLQEFIQEQSKQLQTIKKTVLELDALKKDVGRIDTHVRGVADLAKKIFNDLTAVSGRVNENRTRIEKIEETLARRLVRFSGQIRLRPEYRANQRYFNNLLDQEKNLSGSHRARLRVDAAPAKNLAGRVTMQDARRWGSPTMFFQKEDLGKVADVRGNPLAPSQDRDDSSALRVHEAYVDFHRESFSARVGRQIWDFGAGRMIGSEDWEQAGQSFDGFDLTLSLKNYLRGDLLFAWVEERNATDGSDVLLTGLHVNSPYFETMALDAYIFYLHDDRAGGMRKIATMGGRAAGSLSVHKALFFDLEGAMQFGAQTEHTPGDNKTVDNFHYAMFMHAELGYDISVPTSPSLAIVFEMASGDGNTSPNDPGNDLSAGFVPLFPSRHNMFGQMDLWHQRNIWDVGGRLRLSPLKELDVELEFHSLHTYADTGSLPWGGDDTGSWLQPLETSLGEEVDLRAEYSVQQNLSLAAGYGLFIPGGVFVDLDERDPIILEDETTGEPYRYPRGDPAHWLYLQADFTF